MLPVTIIKKKIYIYVTNNFNSKKATVLKMQSMFGSRNVCSAEC